MKKFIKLFYVVLIVFILLNISIVSPIFATSSGSGAGNIVVKTSFGATLLLGIIRFAQVALTGYWVIRFTIIGIQYFTSVSAQAKADLKGKVMWNLFLAVLSFLALYLFGFATGV